MEVKIMGTSKYIYIYTDTEIIEFEQNKYDCTLEDRLRKLILALGCTVEN